MKKGWVLLLVGVWFSGCKDKASTESRIDSLGTKIDTEASKVWDSAKVDLKKAGKVLDEKTKNLKIKVSNKLEIGDTSHKQTKGKR
jgi:hypothetical protein